MSDGIDENSNPFPFDVMTGFDCSDFPMDPESDTIISSIQDWLSQPTLSSSSSPFYINHFNDHNDCIKLEPSDTSVDRKEWLVQDSISNRYRSPRLFEFLILLLDKPHYQCIASFTDRSRGLFEVHQPDKVAELWQAVKSRQSHQKMTYDKFARAIRWYYKSNIMQKTNTRYTFQFSAKTLKAYFFDENNNDTISLSA